MTGRIGLLDTLMAETKRLLREKEDAVHAVATALMEQGELIGEELDAVFQAADAANPQHAAPFERKVVTLPKLFQDPAQASGGNWAVEGAPAAVPAAFLATGWAGRWRPEDG